MSLGAGGSRGGSPPSWEPAAALAPGRGSGGSGGVRGLRAADPVNPRRLYPRSEELRDYGGNRPEGERVLPLPSSSASRGVFLVGPFCSSFPEVAAAGKSPRQVGGAAPAAPGAPGLGTGSAPAVGMG